MAWELPHYVVAPWGTIYGAPHGCKVWMVFDAKMSFRIIETEAEMDTRAGHFFSGDVSHGWHEDHRKPSVKNPVAMCLERLKWNADVCG